MNLPSQAMPLTCPEAAMNCSDINAHSPLAPGVGTSSTTGTRSSRKGDEAGSAVLLPRSASTGMLASSSRTSTTACSSFHHVGQQQQQQTKQPPSWRSCYHSLRNTKGTTSQSSKDVLSVVSDSSSSVPAFYVPLKSCLSHNQLDTLLMGNDNTNHNNGSSSTIKKCVSFHRIEIREHVRALGDSSSEGPALAIGWESADLMSLAVEDYERLRPPRRHKAELAVPRHVRESILFHEAGVTHGEMAAANRERRRHKQHLGGPALRGIQKLWTGNKKAAATQRQVDELLEQSRRVEEIREQQRQAYLAQLMEELKVQQQQQQDEEQEEEEVQEQQVPGQSTWEEERNELSVEMLERKDRKPSFLPDHGLDEHGGGDEKSTDVLEF